MTLCFDWITALFTTPGSRSRTYLSTKTLFSQGLVLSFLCLWLFTVLIPTTVFVRTRHAKVSDSTNMLPENLATVDTVYWNIGFLRCLAAAPWFSFIAAFPTAIVALCASRLAIDPRVSNENATAEGKGKMSDSG